MVLEWRQREDEDMDREAMQDAPTMQALQQCGLMKFYCTSNMRANVHLLETLISYWDHDLGICDIQGEVLDIMVQVMYFITDISHKGVLVNLEGTTRGGAL